MRIEKSKSSEWRTPAWLFEALDRRFHFDFDACASAENNLCDKYCDISSPFENTAPDMISRAYAAVFCNPPYDTKTLWKITSHIIKICFVAQAEGFRFMTALLVPCKTDQEWWMQACYFATEINFIQKRLRFSGSKDTSQQSHAVFIFDANFLRQRHIKFIFQPNKKGDK